MISTQVVETSFTVNNSSFQNYPHNTNLWYRWVQTNYYDTVKTITKLSMEHSDKFEIEI